MILLPYMYGNLFLRNADGTFTVFRLGTHGKQRIEALEETTKGLTTEQIRKNAYRRKGTYGVFCDQFHVRIGQGT